MATDVVELRIDSADCLQLVEQSESFVHPQLRPVQTRNQVAEILTQQRPSLLRKEPIFTHKICHQLQPTTETDLQQRRNRTETNSADDTSYFR